MPLFFLILAVLYITGNGYIYFRSWEMLRTFPLLWKWVFSVCYWAGTFSFFYLFGHRELPEFNPVIHILYYIGTGWLIFTLYMVLFLLCTDLLRVFNIGFNYRFISCFVLTILLLTGGYIHYSHPKKEVINIDINKEVTGKKQIRVVAISDIHIGYGTTKERLQQYIRTIQAEKPDLILISGDLIDSNLKPVREQRMEQELNQLQAPLGVFMIPGNHEYISGIGKSRAFIRQQTSIQWLQDSVVTLPNGIQLIGRDDRHNPRRKSIAQLTDTLPAHAPSILLDHQPYHLEEAEQAKIDLQFSGHTHDGQIWPLNLITDHLFEVGYGYKQKGNTHIYVSSGLSLWGPPFRIGTRSEMVIFNINFQ